MACGRGRRGDCALVRLKDICGIDAHHRGYAVAAIAGEVGSLMGKPDGRQVIVQRLRNLFIETAEHEIERRRR